MSFKIEVSLEPMMGAGLNELLDFLYRNLRQGPYLRLDIDIMGLQDFPIPPSLL